MKVWVAFAFGLLSLAPVLAFAQPNADPEAAVETSGDDASTDEKVQELTERLRQLDQLIVARQPRVTFSLYSDFGFFAPIGNKGQGVIQDVGSPSMRAFPAEASRYAWVFLGDPLATAVNSRGEAADLGSPPGINLFDSVHSNGAPGFIVNEVNLTAHAAVADNALATISLNFTPRNGTNFSLGDSFDVDQAQLEWMLGRERRTSIFVGKFDSVLGIEYRERKAPSRFGITPSLLARYTTGTPLGLKMRSKWGANDQLVLALAVTNGSSGVESFHFYNEIDTNAGKTVSGRLSFAPSLPFFAEVGFSGEYGPQDHALDSRTPLWFIGVDVHARAGAFELKGQWLRASADGETDARYADPNRPWGLRLHNGAYLELDWMATTRLGFLARGELRDADVWLGNPTAPGGADFLYITRNWRATMGARFAFNDRVLLKAEYLHNGEYAGIPSFADDVLTSSLVLIY